jgi:hypothetical protein
MEMLVPYLSAGVEETGQGNRFGVYPGKVRPLVTIAEMAGEREIGHIVAAMMLPRDDVLDMKRNEIVTLMDVAIFAAVPRSAAHI